MEIKSLSPRYICTPMSTAALSTIPKTWPGPKCPLTGGWMTKLRHLYTVDCHSVTQGKETLPFVTTWLDLEGIMPSENELDKERQKLYDPTYGVCKKPNS